jgi:hypothetical protein
MTYTVCSPLPCFEWNKIFLLAGEKQLMTPVSDDVMQVLKSISFDDKRVVLGKKRHQID